MKFKTSFLKENKIYNGRMLRTIIIPELLENALNRRWIENKDIKHSKNAIGGWYRYDSFFSIRVYEQGSEEYRLNYYSATIIVRINDTGNYLYDVINIKKEARKPMDY